MSTAALAAESSLRTMVKMIATHTVTNSFLANPWSPESTIVPVNASVAERTLQKSKESTCWGCGATDHRWYDSVTKVFLCPKKNDPTCIARADSMRQQFREKRATKKNKSKGGKDTPIKDTEPSKEYKSPKRQADDEGSTHNTPSKIGKTYSFSEGELGSLFASFFHKIKGEDKESGEFLFSTNGDKNKDESANLQFSFIVRVPTFHSEAIKKLPLPIAINSLLPHFQLLIGKRSGREEPGGLWCLYDSGAALNVGYLPFHKYIMEKYPEKVKAIYCADTQEYDHIVLAGVVESEESSVRCRLPMVVEYYLPFKHRAITMNTPTDNLSIRIALGNEVGVNTIIGMASIMGAELTLDTKNKVICSSVWNVQPLSVVYKKPSRGKPEDITSPALLAVTKRKRSFWSDDDADSSDEEPDKIVKVEDMSNKDVPLDIRAEWAHPNADPSSWVSGVRSKMKHFDEVMCAHC